MASGVVDVYVKLSSGASKQYDVDPSTRIESVVAMVAEDEGVACKVVRLKHQGKILVNSKTVGEYGVRAETILKSEILIPKTLALVVHLPDEKIEEITISNLDSVNALHDTISEISGHPKNRLLIKCKGNLLNSSPLSLLEKGIENCSELTVTIKEIEEPAARNTNTNDEATPMDESEKEAVLSSFQNNGRPVEVVFSFDTTGSMFSWLAEVRRKLGDTCRRLMQGIPDIRIGLMAHGDYCDQSDTYVLRSVDLTNNIDRLLEFAEDVPSTSGGDSPECYEWVLRKAQFLDWAEDSAKALVVIGDLYPHPPSYTDQNIEWRIELDMLKGMGVKVYGVQAGSNREADNFYAEIAERTEGRHLKLTHFDIITDMFLAVCYREGDEEMLEQFESEMQEAGRMTDGARAMFDELKETDEEKKKKREQESASRPNERYVNEEWWDHSKRMNGKNPKYGYDQQKDFWSPYHLMTTGHDGASSNRRFTITRSRASTRSKKSKRRCVLM